MTYPIMEISNIQTNTTFLEAFWLGLSYFYRLEKAQKNGVFPKIICKIQFLGQKIECRDLQHTAKVIFWDR